MTDATKPGAPAPVYFNKRDGEYGTYYKASNKRFPDWDDTVLKVAKSGDLQVKIGDHTEFIKVQERKDAKGETDRFYMATMKGTKYVIRSRTNDIGESFQAKPLPDRAPSGAKVDRPAVYGTRPGGEG